MSDEIAANNSLLLKDVFRSSGASAIVQQRRLDGRDVCSECGKPARVVHGNYQLIRMTVQMSSR
jgi:hypothetical protein